MKFPEDQDHSYSPPSGYVNLIITPVIPSMMYIIDQISQATEGSC